MREDPHPHQAQTLGTDLTGLRHQEDPYAHGHLPFWKPNCNLVSTFQRDMIRSLTCGLYYIEHARGHNDSAFPAAFDHKLLDRKAQDWNIASDLFNMSKPLPPVVNVETFHNYGCLERLPVPAS